MVNVVDTFKADANLILETYFNDYVDAENIGEAKAQIEGAEKLLGYSLSSVVADYIQDPDDNISGKTLYERMKFVLNYNGTDTVNGLDAFNIDDVAHQEKADILEDNLKSYYKETVTSTMTVDQQVMYAGYCAWVFERRGADLNSAWTYDSEYYYDSVPGAINICFDFFKLLVSYSDLNDSRKKIMFNDDDLTDLNKDFEISNGNINDLVINGRFKFEHITPVGLSTHLGLDLGKELYNYKATYIFNSKRSITVEGQSNKLAVFTAIYAQLHSELENSKDNRKYELPKLIASGFEGATQWGLSLAKVIKSFQAAKKQKEIRKFNRVCDTTGTVPTLEEGAFSYVKAGFTINTDDDKKGKTTEITDEPLTPLTPA